jgi:hypothetical protein
LDRSKERFPLDWTQDAVMAVLVTAIHAFAARQDVDARDKPAHDGAIVCDRNMPAVEPEHVPLELN